MTPAYERMYLADAEDCLAGACDFAVNDCGVPIDLFAAAFVRSGFAMQFERGNPAVIAGMSGLDLACEALSWCGLLDDEPEPTYGRGRSAEYWAGQMMAFYAWCRACRFSDLFERVSPKRIVGFYHLLHEADKDVFVEQIDHLISRPVGTPTNLSRLRRLHHLSQSQLARASGVGLKSIQAYEQRTNSLNKASGETLLRLATTLDCTIEQLMEFEPRVTVEYLPREHERT